MEDIIIKNINEYNKEKEFSKTLYSDYISNFYMLRYQLRRATGKNSKESRIETIKELQEVLIFLAEEKTGKKPKYLG